MLHRNRGYKMTPFVAIFCSALRTMRSDTKRVRDLSLEQSPLLIYVIVLYQCGLERDLGLFDAGDMTEVGEKGLTLR